MVVIRETLWGIGFRGKLPLGEERPFAGRLIAAARRKRPGYVKAMLLVTAFRRHEREIFKGLPNANRLKNEILKLNVNEGEQWGKHFYSP